MNTIQPIRALKAIDSIDSLDSLKALNIANQAAPQQDVSSPAIPFRSMYEDAVSNVKQTDTDLNSEIYKMTTGQSDDLHNAVIAAEKANLSINMAVELRNKLLDAYKEVMNINI